MAIDDPTERLDDFVLSWQPPRLMLEKSEHIAGVLRRFGMQRRSTFRKIVQELDRTAVDYRLAWKKRPTKFAEADIVLKKFETVLRKTNKMWLRDLRPLHPAIIALCLELIPAGERKQKASATMAWINLDLVSTTLLHIVGKLRDPKTFSAAHYQTGGKSRERMFLWDPLFRLMKAYDVKPGQHGSFLGAVKSLHLALGIDPPSEGAVKKMLHDLRQGVRSNLSTGYGTTKKRRNA